MLGLLTVVVLVGLGERMAERFLPIYLMALGGGVISIGLLSGLDNLLSALYAFPGGYLADRLGAKRALLIFNLMAMVGFLVVVLVPAWPAVLAGAVLFLSWTAISLPATMGLVSRVLPGDKRTMGVSMHSLVRRVPMALGPIVGGWLIGVCGEQKGVRLAFAVSLILAALASVIQQRLIEEDRPASRPAQPDPRAVFREMSPALKRLLISDILVRFCEQIPQAFVVVWCMKMVASPVTAFQFGVLTAIEMTTAVLVYVPVAWLADRTEKKPFVLITFGFFTLFPLALYFCRSFPALVGAFILRGLKEFGEPTRKALIMDLAPDDRKAGMFGLYYLIRDIVVSVAAFGGAILWGLSPRLNLFAAFTFGVVGTAGYALFGPTSPRARPADGAPTP